MSVSQVLGSLGVPEGTASDGTVDTSINLHNVTQLKDLVDLGLSPEQRAQHAGALLDGITAPAGQPGVSLLHRLIGHVVGNDELSQEDHAQLAAALPITAHVTTQVTPDGTAQPAPDGTAQPAPGGTAQPAPGGTAQTAPGGTASPPAGPPMQVSTVWDVSTPDGSLRVIDLPNGIELLDGGCIVARSTPLHFTCSSLTRAGGPPAGVQRRLQHPRHHRSAGRHPGPAARTCPGAVRHSGNVLRRRRSGRRRRERCARAAGDGGSRRPAGQRRYRQRPGQYHHHRHPDRGPGGQEGARGGDPVRSGRPGRQRRPRWQRPARRQRRQRRDL